MERERLMTQIHGGKNRVAFRAGTLPTHQIAAMGKACALAKEYMTEEQLRIQALRDHLQRFRCADTGLE